MKTVHIYYYIIFIVLTLTSCNHNNTKQELRNIDSLIFINKLDYAYNEIKDINTNFLSEENKAYYNLLWTQIQYLTYKPIKSDSIINECVEYYKINKDNRKLGESYYYKGMIEQLLGKADSAIINLKEAENIASNISNIELKHKIYYGLVELNYATANYALALEYSHKELYVSQEVNNISWIAYAYNHLSCVHDKLGNRDSVYHYIKCVMPYINKVSNDAKAYHLSNIGQYYLHYKDTSEAQKYLVMSYNTKPIPETINMLSKIYYAKNDKESAFKLLNQALKNFHSEEKIKIYETLANLYFLEKEYKEYGIISENLKQMKDSLAEERHTYTVHELQIEYDNNKKDKETKIQTRNTILISITFIVIFVIFIITFYFKRRVKEKNRTNELINKYKSKIDTLKTSENDLNKEIKKIKLENSESLSYGYSLHKNIIDGGTTIQWKKSDFQCFIRYYQVINPKLFNEIEKKYNDLSAINITILIMQDMEFDNERIRHAMCMSAGALRAARFRIKAKEKKNNTNK